jgi:hypothetical protein
LWAGDGEGSREAGRQGGRDCVCVCVRERERERERERVCWAVGYLELVGDCQDFLKGCEGIVAAKRILLSVPKVVVC